MVVSFHTQSSTAETFSNLRFTNSGAAGVDIFFVISGFIMVLTSFDRFDQKGASIKFLKARIRRILPTYYLFTTVTVIILLVFPDLYQTLRFNPEQTICSYLLLLSNDITGNPGTLIGVGWTLSFEAFFYIVFAIMLNFEKKYLLPSLTILFSIGVIVGYIFEKPHPSTIVITNPLLFEFLFGCCLGFIYKKEVSFNKYALLLSIVIGFVWIYSAGETGWVKGFLDRNRVFAFGIPSMIVVAGSVLLEKEIGFKIHKSLLTIGDSSYSLYLSHQYTLQACSLLLFPLLIAYNVPSIIVVTIGIGITVLFGLVSYLLFEKPVSKALNKTILPTEILHQNS